MFARTNAIGAVLVVSTLLCPVTCVSAFAALGGPDGTAATSGSTGQGDDGRGWIGNWDGEGGPLAVASAAPHIGDGSNLGDVSSLPNYDVSSG